MQRLDSMRSIESMRSTLCIKEIGSKLNFCCPAMRGLTSRAIWLVFAAISPTTCTGWTRRVPIESFRRGFPPDGLQELVENLSQARRCRRRAEEGGASAEADRASGAGRRYRAGACRRTLGSVVREAETLFVLVPRDVPLQAEVNVEGRISGKYQSASPCASSSRPFRSRNTEREQERFGLSVRTRLRLIRKSKLRAVIIAPYYRVLVDLIATRNLNCPAERAQLMPGMAVTAELKVGQRSVMSYFLYPLLRGLDESIREP